MNAHAQHASELFLQGTGLSYFVDNAEDDMPAGWAEMLSAMSDAFGELVEHATTVKAADATDAHRLRTPDHAEFPVQAARWQNCGGPLAVITAHAEASDATAVEMADRAAAGVVNRYRSDAAAAIETIHATTSAAVRAELAGKVCGLVMLHGSVMTLTNNDDVHVHFGWRSNPSVNGGSLWQDGHEPVRTWDDPLSATKLSKKSSTP